jgi:NADPH-dependent 2,4-dienoyl-CoA reductase/sulfur reductase-like enzyme
MNEHLVIIGGVAAGMSAAAKARRSRPDLEITVYEKSGYISYGACGFPYFIKDDISDIDELIARTPAQAAKQNITAHVDHEVLAIDPRQKTLQGVNLQTGREFINRWDKLVVATGASVSRPPLPGINLSGIFSLRTVEDALAIKNWITAEKPRRGVVVGAGYIGLEMAEALCAHGIDVTIVDMAGQVMSTLDPDMAELVQAELEAQHVHVCLQQKVLSFIGPEQVTEIVRRVTQAVERQAIGQTKPQVDRWRVHEVVTDQGVLPADIVIFGVGSRPAVTVAATAGIATGQTGAIAVDDQQRTNIPDVWAAGAVAETFHLILKKPSYIPLATTANKQGRVAGANAAGGADSFGGVVGTAVVKAFDLSIASTGLSEGYARAAGFDTASVTIDASSRAHYMPSSQPMRVKLVFERDSQLLLGAQIIGQDGVDQRINVIAAALHAGWTTRQLSEIDLGYAPPFAPVWDPVLVAANVANH